MTKYCSKCGNPLPNDARFCMNCGMPVEGVASVREMPAGIARWEYHEEHLDLSTITVSRSSLPRYTQVSPFTKGNDIPINHIQFRHRQGPDERNRARGDAWKFLQPILERHLNDLGKGGWELTTQLDYNIVSGNMDVYNHDSYNLMWTFTIITVGLLLVVVIPYLFLARYQWDIYQGATLRLRRMVA